MYLPSTHSYIATNNYAFYAKQNNKINLLETTSGVSLST